MHELCHIFGPGYIASCNLYVHTKFCMEFNLADCNETNSTVLYKHEHEAMSHF